MTLVKELEQLLYTHAPNIPHKKTIMELVKTWEDAYQQRIAELEAVDARGNVKQEIEIESVNVDDDVPSSWLSEGGSHDYDLNY